MDGIFTTAQKAGIEHKKAQYFEEINLEIMEEKTERIIQPKEEPFIVSLKKRIEKKSWTSLEKVVMCKETENGFEQQENVADNNVILVETNDKYEIIIDVNNIANEAEIREDYFEKIGKRLKLTLEPNGGNGDREEKEVRKGFKIKLEQPSYTKSGYKFVGWCEDKDGVGTRYIAGSEYKVEEDTQLYAIWETNAVTLTLKANDETEASKEISVTPNEEITLPTEEFTREGYTFVNWNTQADGTGTAYEKGAKITLTRDMELYAQWEVKITATMSFEVNNETGIKKLTEGTKIKIGATALSSGIEKVELKIGSQVMYTETVNSGTTYTKELGIEDLTNLANLLFYSENVATLTVISINNNSEQISENRVQNYTVGSATSLNRLAQVVNSGTTLSGETILQIKDITTSANYVPIGYYDGGVWYTGKYFAGTYEGNNHSVTITSMTTNSTTYVSTGIFGMIVGGNIYNLTAKGTNNFPRNDRRNYRSHKRWNNR